MAQRIVIKIRNGQIHTITGDDDVDVIIANYDTFSSGTDPYAEPCHVYREPVLEDPREAGEFEDILERRREAMRRKGGC